MSENENSTDKIKESAQNIIDKVLTPLLKLKDENAKAFYGGIGVVAVLFIYMMMSGGNPEVISGANDKNLVVGQQYTLKAPNSYDKYATIRLVGAPGSMEAYDDTEKADRTGCKHLPQGTKVTIKALVDAYGQKNAFAQVIVDDAGECKGISNWTSVVNITNN